MARDLGVQFNTMPTQKASSAQNKPTLERSQGVLAQSQQLVDKQNKQKSELAKIGIGAKTEPGMANIGVGETSASGPVDFLGQTLKTIGSPFARAAASIGNTFTALTKGKQAADTQAAEGVDLPIYGKTKPIGQTGRGFGADLTDTLGTGAEAAATVIPAGRAGEIASKTLAGTLWSAAKIGAKEGGKSGALFGAGTEAQSPDASPESIIGHGVLGGATGAVGGAVLAPAAGAIGGDVLGNSANKIRNYYAKKEVSPQLNTSATRLQEKAPLGGAGAAIQKKLVDIYNDFAKQEQKHIADIKQDPAISMVGERIGNEFDNVVKMRQKAGSTMAEELKKTGKTPIDLDEASFNLHQDLLENKALFNPKKGQITTGKESKFAQADVDVMEKYASELHKLGDNPTMAAVDAFLSRIPKEIEGLKATRNIQFNTNAERIIEKNMRELRDVLGKNGTPEYNQARADYSKLSNFLDEGVSHLGKKTQSGDYARDASIGKSAVQSVLNNGKKDWLLELENLTGYPALDEAALSLQAMKDAGDSKANSLLELLSEQAANPGLPPTTLGGWLFAGSKAALDAGRRKVIGSPADQTRAFLQSVADARKNRP